MTKRILIVLAAVILISLPLASQDYVYGNGHGNGNGNGSGNGYGNGNGNGNGGNGNGAGDGSGPIHNILDGTPFTFSGTVLSIGYQGDGMVIATADGNVTVQGLGPQRYWDSLDIDKPDLGEQIVAYGYTVVYNDSTLNVLTRVEFNGVAVDLRDSETGVPLWRGGGYQNGSGSGSGYGNYGSGFRYDILGGTPFSFSGDVIYIGSSSCGGRGDGMTIATDTANITVDGLGPLYFWDSLDVARPTIGDFVEVTGFSVDYNGNTLNILMTVTIDGQTVQLRDPETGLPLWIKRYTSN